MWFTPSSTAARNTAIAWSRSPGMAPGANAGPRWGNRIAPNPIRLTLRSPSVQVPAAAAPPISPATAGVCPTSAAAMPAPCTWDWRHGVQVRTLGEASLRLAYDIWTGMACAGGEAMTGVGALALGHE